MRIASKHPLLVGTALAIVCGSALYGCKNFLDENSVPQGTLDAATLSSKGGVEGTLIAAYRALDCNTTTGAWGCAVSNWAFASATSDDAYKGSESNDQPNVDELQLYHWDTPGAMGYLDQKWTAMYDGVVRANAALRLLKQVQGQGKITSTEGAQIAGEAIFLRAHYHFEAWRMWIRIPYYREDDTDFRKPNLDSAAALTEILKDLDSAAKLLPSTPRNGNIGRVHKWTALAYKGRVQAYANQWTAALATLRAIRAAEGTPRSTTNTGWNLSQSYDQVWSGFKANENGPETIFAYQASANDGEPNGNNANFGERLNFPHSGSPFGCCGFHQPSQNLVNYFRVDAQGLPLALSSPTNWNAADANFATDTLNANRLVAVDPRLDWTVGRDGVPFKDWGLHEGGWIRSASWGGPYSAKKNAHERASGAQSSVGWTNTQLNSVNMHIYRYADLLLMLAEAEVEAGVLENARTIVNEVRARAARTAQGCGWPTDSAARAREAAKYPQCAGDTRIAVPINDASIRWATYRVGQYLTPWTSQTTARDAVRAERRLELAMEGQRLFDLRRHGNAATVLNAYINDVGGGAEKNRRTQFTGAEPYLAKHNKYPIPINQLQLSRIGGQNKLTQNPGW
ncbi:MAG TPA: RagB/SusD family nutrient uptake outer membrane protein [Gemmatimonadaceae bacterium]|nr:RagB/SusD family nutrient uptake outer membrane protein [Gemmatimonadaceae bacterium]